MFHYETGVPHQTTLTKFCPFANIRSQEEKVRGKGRSRREKREERRKRGTEWEAGNKRMITDRREVWGRRRETREEQIRITPGGGGPFIVIKVKRFLL